MVQNCNNIRAENTKTKATGLCGKKLQRVKMKTAVKFVEQVNNFNYFENFISVKKRELIIK